MTMEKKIEEFSKEKFKFELPKPVFSPASLNITVGTGAKAAGSFKVSLSEEDILRGLKLRGYLTCLDYRMEFDEVSFAGQEKEVRYTFDASFIEAGTRLNGVIRLISDCGEYSIPYEVEVRKKSFVKEDILLEDLYQFAAYAKENSREAVKLFFDDGFDEVFLSGKEKEALLKRGLKYSKNKYHALEEFLCYTKMKQPVRLTVEKRKNDYHLAGKAVKDKIIVKKNSWGYFRATIITEGNYLIVDKTELTPEDFSEDECELNIELRALPTSVSKAFGKIIIHTVYEDIVIDINMINVSAGRNALTGEKRKFAYLKKIIKDYFLYKTGTISAKAAATSVRASLYGIDSSGESGEVKYIGIYLDILTGNVSEAKEALNLTKNESGNLLLETAKLYLEFLTADDVNKKRIVKSIEETAEVNGYMPAYFILLHTDERLMSNPAKRLGALMKLYESGANSPFIFFEAWSIYKEKPELFVRLDEFSVRTVNFAIKNGFFSNKTVRERFVYLAASVKEYNPVILNALREIYKKWAKDEVITDICLQLLKRKEKPLDAHEWFRLAVNKGIKLTGIFELYMDTLSEDSDERIEPAAFTYFKYGNQLNNRKKALMYSYMIRHKEEQDIAPVYEDYIGKIQAFALMEIAKGEISRPLALIYKEVIKDDEFVKKSASKLSKIIFKICFDINNKNMTSLITVTKGVKAVKPIPIQDGTSFADECGALVFFLLSDTEGNFYPAENFSERERVIKHYEYMDICYEAGDRGLPLTLALFDENEKYHKEVKELVEIYRTLLESGELEEDYKLYIKSRLIEYYFERVEIEKLTPLLEDFDFSKVTRKVGLRLAAIAISTDLYPLSAFAVKYTGIDNVDIKKLRGPVLSLITGGEISETDRRFMISATFRLMIGKRAEKEVLIWLRDNFEGSVSEFNELYREIRDNDLLTPKFAERFLEQMLFSEELSVETDKIFIYYYRNVENGILVKAFLSYVFYAWLVKDRRLSEYFEKRAYEEAIKGKNRLPAISYLKLLSKKMKLSVEEKEFAGVHLEKLAEEGIILPFYKNFVNKCRIPAEIENLNFAVCIADNEDEVKIHYRVNAPGEERGFTTEWMKNVYMGIFVKEFLIFADEEAQYYISIKRRGEEEFRPVSSDKLTLDIQELLDNDICVSLYSQINMMFVAKELDDTKTLQEYMKNYVIQKEVVKGLFSSLGEKGVDAYGR